MPATRIRRILARTVRAFMDDNITRLGAALAFYTTIAVAPLMVIALAIAGVFFKGETARETLVREIREVIGSPAAEAVATLQSPGNEPQGVLATTVGVISLVFGAMGVFSHLQDALNSIWRVEPPRLAFWAMVRYRLSSLAVVLATGFLLLVSLVLSAGLAWITTWGFNRVGLPAFYLEMANAAVSFGVVMFLFALLFKLLPDTRVPWKHVWLGAGVTAALFTFGKFILGLYLAHARVTSAYGAAGSLVALLLWCYYAGQIVFLGAEFTRVTAMSDGGRDFSPLDAPAEKVRIATTHLGHKRITRGRQNRRHHPRPA